ncbi:MAG: type II and III secretion system protein, partial [Candidatus Omnitrophica bacterium]|nr:type II and III secretion system protein [Candidatus Omnitrophota bacterium]
DSIHSGLSSFPFAGADAFTFGTLDFSQFSMVLEALFNRGDTEILSSPRIATIDNKPASIHVGDTVPIPMYERNAETGNMEVTGYEEIQVGIRLTVTPHINQDGFILMEIVPTVSSITGFTGPNNERPITSQRTAQTTVMIKNGETVMIGGLIKENNVKTEKKVPILGDLPVIKYLFKHKVDTKQRTELLVFITPNLMKSGRIGGAVAAETETN